MSRNTEWGDGGPTDAAYAGRPPFVQIPEKLILDPEMSAMAVRVYCILAHHVNRTSGTAWPSHATIAGYLGISDRGTVIKYLTELRERGWIDWRRRATPGGRASNLYRLNAHPSQSRQAPTLADTEAKVGERLLSAVGERLHEPYRDEPDRDLTPPTPQGGRTAADGGEPLEGQTDVLELLGVEHPASSRPAPARRNRTKVEPLPDTDPRFTALWATYPRRAGKGDARKALAKALTRAPWAEIYAGVQRFAADPNLPTDGSKIPYPATWLNGDRWEDDPEPVRYDGAQRPSAAAQWGAVMDAYDKANDAYSRANTHNYGEIGR